MSGIDLSPEPGLTAQHVTLIGSIISWWSACEQTLFDDVMLRRKEPAVEASGAAWPMQIQSKKLITQWRNVANVLVSEYGSGGFDLDSLENRLRRLNGIRNLIAHGFYDVSKKHPLTVALFRWDDGLGTFVNEPFVVDTQTLTEIRDANHDLYQDLGRWSDYIDDRIKERSATEPKGRERAWPAALLLAPKPLRV